MVSVAIHNHAKKRPYYVSEWTPDMKMQALAEAKQRLGGVGVDATDIVLFGQITVSIRRMATDAERLRVPENFLCLTSGANNVPAPEPTG
jgi:hypothetical protein